MPAATVVEVEFSVAGVRRAIALPAAAVRRVVRMPATTPVPLAPPGVVGLANVRGDIVPVLDAALFVDDAGAAVESVPRAYVVVVETARGLTGLAVDSPPVAMSEREGGNTVVDVEALIPQ